MDLKLQKQPKEPEFNNSAGRLLRLFQMLGSSQSKNHYDTIGAFFAGKQQGSNEFKAKSYLQFMSMLGKAFNDFISDVQTTEKIPEPTKGVILGGINRLLSIAYPMNPTGVPAQLQDAEVALLRMAGSMLDQEPMLEESDTDAIRESIESLRKEIEESDVSKTAKQCMLEVCRLSRNSLDQYTIYGSRGFKDAFKRMLAELMAIYLDEGDEIKSKSWWRKTVDHAKLFDTVAAKLSKYKPLLESATIFLGNG